MKNYIIGIDIGGSYIKSGIVKYDGEIVASMKIPTPMSVGVGSMENVFKTIAARLTEQAGITKENIIGVGVGSAGAVDSSLGEVCFAANLTMERFPLASVAEEALGLPVKVANDANCACLGEWKFQRHDSRNARHRRGRRHYSGQQTAYRQPRRRRRNRAHAALQGRQAVLVRAQRLL